MEMCTHERLSPIWYGPETSVVKEHPSTAQSEYRRNEKYYHLKILQAAQSDRGFGYPIRPQPGFPLDEYPWYQQSGCTSAPKLVTILGTRHVTPHESLQWERKKGKREKRKKERKS